LSRNAAERIKEAQTLLLMKDIGDQVEVLHAAVDEQPEQDEINDEENHQLADLTQFQPLRNELGTIEHWRHQGLATARGKWSDRNVGRE